MQDSSEKKIGFTYSPIGFVHPPFTDIVGMPIQPSGARGVRGTIDLLPEYVEGLKDLDGFSRIVLIYAFHRSTDYKLVVTPFLDPKPHGVFATRAPTRPNAIGLSVVRLRAIRGTTLEIEDVDILDGTPVLDIKPYVPGFDAYGDAKAGWLDKKSTNASTFKSDERFR